MDTQTIAIVAVGATLLVAILAGYGIIVPPLLVMILRDNARANRDLCALANHRLAPSGAPTFNLTRD